MRLHLLLLLLFILPVRLLGLGNTWAAPQNPSADTGLINKAQQKNAKAMASYLYNAGAARALAEQALLVSKKAGYRDGIGQSLLIIGFSYWAQSYYPVSLFYLKSALPYLQQKGGTPLSSCYRVMARNYTDINDLDNAMLFARRAQLAAGNDVFCREEAMSQFSLIYMRQKQYDKAAATIFAALRLAKTVNNYSGRAILYSRLCNINVELKNFDAAQLYLDTARSLGLHTNNRRVMASLFVSQAVILSNKKQFSQALSYARHAVSLADSIGVADLEIKSMRTFINIYQASGDDRQAQLYAVKYMSVIDSLTNIDRRKSAQLIQDYFKLTNRLENIDLIEHDTRSNALLIRSQRTTIIVLVSAMVVLITALYILYMYYKQKNNLSKELEEQRDATIAQNELIVAQAEHLEGLNHLKNKLLAVIGHDLRGPIDNLRNVSDLFDEGLFSVDEVQHVMKTMNPVIKGAELTLSNLLEWAGSQIRGNNVETACVSIQGSLAEVLQGNMHLIEKKEITLINNVDGAQLGLADQNHLKIIFRNLINNAIKFTPQGGSINIDVRPEDDKLVISIADTGQGMSPNEIAKMLSVKTYFSKRGTAGEKGTGLGLLLCRELVELNGGDLWLTSEVNQGSTFYFTLPAC